VAQAFPNGDFPPIVVYQVGDAYFVVDGHHRVAIARQRGMETIDAEVTSLRSRWRLPAEADIVQIIHAEQEQMFMEQSGLAGEQLDAPIRFSRPAGYPELLENVQIHGYHVMLDAGRALPRSEIAHDWYERVYRPAVEAIRRERLDAVTSGATEADMFLCVYQRRRDLFANRGCRPLEEAAHEWSAEEGNGERRGLGRLLRRRVD
jgi:ParB-like nuclease domain